MISIDLSDRTILITGALGAIAEHMVRRLTETGATLVLTDVKSEQEAEQTLHTCIFRRHLISISQPTLPTPVRSKAW